MSLAVSARAPLSWYETGLPLSERKQRGHFSTPPPLVEQILDACGYTSTNDLSRLRVLDPACGSGNFLARAAQRLCQSQNLQQRESNVLVQRNIWGLDPDPVACCLAELQVRAVVNTAHAAYRPALKLHIHQADSLTLPWQPCVDLLLANPPYLASKNTDLSHYREARSRGQADSYLLFLDLALRAVRPGGWIGLVLPDPVLARSNAAHERQRLLRTWTLHHLWHLSTVFSADVGAVVLIAQNCPPSSLHQVAWTRARWSATQPTGQLPHTVNQAIFTRQPGAELRYLLNTPEGCVSERLRRALEDAPERPGLHALKELVDIKRGEELGRTHRALKPLSELVHGHRVLRGGVDLHSYAQPQATWGIELAHISKPLARYLEPKLLIVKSSDHLQAALDIHGHVVLQTLYLLRLRGEGDGRERGRRKPAPSLHAEGDSACSVSNPLDTYYFLLALLNSRLLRAYVTHLHTAYKLAHPQIEQAVLARLPVAWGTDEARREIAERARTIEQACSRAGAVVEWEQHPPPLYEEQERAICALYAAAVPGIFEDKGVLSL